MVQRIVQWDIGSASSKESIDNIKGSNCNGTCSGSVNNLIQVPSSHQLNTNLIANNLNSNSSSAIKGIIKPKVQINGVDLSNSLEEEEEVTHTKRIPEVHSCSTLVSIPEENGARESHSLHETKKHSINMNGDAFSKSRRRSSIMQSIPKLFGFNKGSDQHHRTSDASAYSYGGNRSQEPAAKEARRRNRRNGDDALTTALSALYAKLIIILGIAMPLTEILSHRVLPHVYQLYYVYLYVVSIMFVGFVYLSRIRMKPYVFKGHHKKTNSFGSFYLRVGAIAFGIGSMVYSGLEFGQYFELRSDPKCGSIFIALTPAFRMILTLSQMQFIFLNTSDFDMGNHKVISRFGLMHLLATNICEWLFILVEETKHEIHHLTIDHEEHESFNESELRNYTGISPKCERNKIMGRLVQDVSPFLYPCTIEYSLICAVILYEMWKKVKSLPNIEKTRRDSMKTTDLNDPGIVLSVDCSNSHRGIFCGVIIFVLTIISMIMYFVLYEMPEYENMAIQEVSFCELIIYLISSFAVFWAFHQMRDLRYYRKFIGHHASRIKLDCTLLVVAQFGSYLYTIFSIIGNYFAIQEGHYGGKAGFATEIFCICQTSLQTLFILNASWRRCRGATQKRQKPGREMVTFLLISNMCMWLVNTMIKGRAQFRPGHFEYFGLWAWTIIVHVSMPLSIFYRFHASICFFEIWKSAYKGT